ncbi:hypothetical protein ACTOB_003801 [Actinoplanes oblitus]|uniref:Uncharacterized protein n=1 Tax=Actinoplanes oblitus TaxID=3040509 RepID=A0ABY8WQG4_9ACTN|nr:hypothetical protein [Actinoplanes oblitus]WIN00117.1 hypothetical protein ACTOB_003801 [Actinoplanes oblitus]
MTQFIHYVRTAGEQRFQVVSGMDEPYSPVKDPYAPMRRAIKNGRRTGQDHIHLNLALTRCRKDFKSHFAAIAKGWFGYLGEHDFTAMIDVSPGRWETPDLAVRVTPDFAVEHPDGTVEAIKLYLLADPIDPRVAELTTWLMQHTMDQTCPGAHPVVLDVRRRTAHTALPQRPRYQTWLESEAHALAYLLAHPAA